MLSNNARGDDAAAECEAGGGGAHALSESALATVDANAAPCASDVARGTDADTDMGTDMGTRPGDAEAARRLAASAAAV